MLSEVLVYGYQDDVTPAIAGGLVDERVPFGQIYNHSLADGPAIDLICVYLLDHGFRLLIIYLNLPLLLASASACLVGVPVQHESD